jgi:hypothetical protein
MSDFDSYYKSWRAETQLSPINVYPEERDMNTITLPDPIELKLAEAESLAKVGGAAATGIASATAGFVGDVESLGRGVVEVMERNNKNFMGVLGELYNKLGAKEVGNLLTNIYGEDKRSTVDAFLEGLNQDTIFPDMADVEEKILATGIPVPEGDMEALKDGLIILGSLFSGEMAIGAGIKKLRKGKK